MTTLAHINAIVNSDIYEEANIESILLAKIKIAKEQKDEALEKRAFREAITRDYIKQLSVKWDSGSGRGRRRGGHIGHRSKGCLVSQTGRHCNIYPMGFLKPM